MKTPPRLLAVLLALSVVPLTQVLYPGCATVVDGPTQTIRVKSKPTDARVYLNGHAVGETPVTVRISRWGWHRVRLELPGFVPYELPLQRGFNSNSQGNLFLGFGPIVVDALTGAIFEHRVREGSPDGILRNEWKDGDEADVLVTVGLHPLGPARKIGQMERRKK